MNEENIVKKNRKPRGKWRYSKVWLCRMRRMGSLPEEIEERTKKKIRKKKIKIKIKKIGHWEINFVKLAWGRTTILLISCSRLAFPERSVKLTGITFFRLRVKAHGS